MNYHNPEQLSEWGQADGWRLLTTEEIKQPLPSDAEFFDCEEWHGAAGDYISHWTYRTRRLLPTIATSDSTGCGRGESSKQSSIIAQLDADIKAKQELKEIALAVEGGAEWEVNWPGVGKWENPVHSLKHYIDHRAPVRLKPKPVTRLWSKPEDVPGPVCWISFTSSPHVYELVVEIKEEGIYIGKNAMFWAWGNLRNARASTDRINWKPCEVTEEAK